MKIIWQSLILIFSFSLVFGWEQIPALSFYTIPAIGFLIFLYLIVTSRKKKALDFLNGDSPWSIFTINSLILLLIFSTGDINSPIFFLLYFLAFGVAFVFEPEVIFVFMLGIILVFMSAILKDDITANMLKVGSLILLSTLAFVFGREYKKSEKQDESTQALKERAGYAGSTIEQDAEEILEEENHLKSTSVDKLKEVIEEAQDLEEETEN